MIKKKIYAFICARGGSKGIKDKNIKSFCGKPLISYSIKSALENKLINKVIVSTDLKKLKKSQNTMVQKFHLKGQKNSQVTVLKSG